MKRLLDVGNCDPDHHAIRSLVERHFEVQTHRAHDLEDAFRLLGEHEFDLVTVNRVFDRDGFDGIELIRRLKADPTHRGIPVMLISNYSRYQTAAVDAGAELGFGKSELRASETVERLRRFLTD